MAGGYAWSRRVGARVRTLRGLVHDTQRALRDIVDIITVDPNIFTFVQDIGQQCIRNTALVILGSGQARVRLVHCLLGRSLLPEHLTRGRWIRIQYGTSTQVNLSVGDSEFELVEELECNRRAWEILPIEDLQRREDEDLTTMLEVELNNQFLRDGLKIVLPPDIPTEPGDKNHLQLKSLHSELYQKRASILRNFNCVYLYAVDKIGKNVFRDNVVGNLTVSRSDEDFWSSFSLYTGGKSGGENGGSEERGVWRSVIGEPAVFSAQNCLDLHQMKELNCNSQPLFLLLSEGVTHVETATPVSQTRTRCEPEADPTAKCESEKQRLMAELVTFMGELMEQWELMSNPPQKHYVKSQWAIIDDGELLRTVDLKSTPAFTSNSAHSTNETCGKGRTDKILRHRSALLSTVVKFATESVQSYLLEYCTRLSEVHIKLLERFILASFDMARELQVVPKKIQYVAVHEQQLFETINAKFSEGEKKQELLEMMQEVLRDMDTDINNMDWSVDDLPCHQDQRFAISNSTFYCSTVSSPSLPLSPLGEAPSDGEEAASYDSYNLDEYDIIGHNEESFSSCYTSRADDDSPISPPTDIRVENETELFSLSSSTWPTRSDVTCCSNTGVSIKHATLDVQQTVLSRLSRKISLKLVKFFDCLKESYFGTLQRCIESLESSCRQELGGKPASEAMRQLLSVGRQVELQPNAAFSLLRTLLDSLRRLFNKLRIVGSEDEEACCVLSPVWRRRVALHTTHSMSPHRLARIISTQIIERLSVAHERYQSALAALESALANRLHHTEDIKLAIRKKYAPSFARLCLESTSMCDLLIHGTPTLGREIGRGQYGVVYSVSGGWGGHTPVAVKSVLPSDERHYHELAMEFFYTRTIPPHPRIVQLYGSVVQRMSGGTRCVLLVTERKSRDLHAAVRAGLSTLQRMHVATDIVDGIRYLHSLGLVHRDIKLKNVLLDTNNRASLSDLGFCAAGPLISGTLALRGTSPTSFSYKLCSGSVVGTPIHMAPELLNGEYTGAVDVYAFGILFWYLCAGDVKLPEAFECFNNKEELWAKVKKGRRPERLPHFTEQCWSLMQSCWHADPDQRPLLGEIQQQLNAILAETIASEKDTYVRYDSSESDSLDMTGIDNYDM